MNKEIRLVFAFGIYKESCVCLSVFMSAYFVSWTTCWNWWIFCIKCLNCKLKVSFLYSTLLYRRLDILSISGGITPFILDLDIRWRGIATFTYFSRFTLKSQYTLYRRLCEPIYRLMWICWQRQNICFLTEIKSWPSRSTLFTFLG
jgi:hypothetical protein